MIDARRLVAMTIAGASVRRGDVHGRRSGPAEAVSYYWHFVDVVWIMLFLTLYLLDRHRTRIPPHDLP